MNTDNLLTLPQLMPYPGIKAGDIARLSLKSAGANVEMPTADKIDALTTQVMANLKSQGIDADPVMVKSLAMQALAGQGQMVTKATDPVILPQPFVAPTDFSAQYPQPLDPTEILTLCEEITVSTLGTYLQ